LTILFISTMSTDFVVIIKMALCVCADFSYQPYRLANLADPSPPGKTRLRPCAETPEPFQGAFC
jgi:hypothetical protein